MASLNDIIRVDTRAEAAESEPLDLGQEGSGDTEPIPIGEDHHTPGVDSRERKRHRSTLDDAANGSSQRDQDIQARLAQFAADAARKREARIRLNKAEEEARRRAETQAMASRAQGRSANDACPSPLTSWRRWQQHLQAP